MNSTPKRLGVGTTGKSRASDVNDAARYGFDDGLRPGSYAKAAPRLIEMLDDSVLGNTDDLADLPIRLAGPNPLQTLALTRRD